MNLDVIAPEAPEFITEKAKDTSGKIVVFVGDVIPDSAKRTTLYKRGGLLTPQCLTVPNQILNSCALTPLHQNMASVNSDLVDPEKRDRYVSQYTRKQVNPHTGTLEELTLGAKGTPSGHLIFQPIYPAQELATVQRTAVLRDGSPIGVVEVAVPLTASEKLVAQTYYFPNWADIVRGIALLPTKLRDLQAQIQEKRSQVATAQTDDATKVNLAAVGDALLDSCRQFRTWGTSYIKFQNAVMALAKEHPEAGAAYDEIAERLFEVLELTREDKLIASQTMNQNDTSALMAQIAQSQVLMTQLLANAQGVPIGDVAPAVAAPIPVQPVPATPAEAAETPLIPEVIQFENVISAGEPEEGVIDAEAPVSPKRRQKTAASEA